MNETSEDVLMVRETREAGARVSDLLDQSRDAVDALADALRAYQPAAVATVARGSSDHAATYAASVFARAVGKITASVPPSLVSRYGAHLSFDRHFVLGISQSGASPDLVATLAHARSSGAMTAALVNTDGSALAAAAEYTVPQCAGEEKAVAATKSYICSGVAAAMIAAAWAGDDGLAGALRELPDRLSAAARIDWGRAGEAFLPVDGLFVLGRGPCLGIAQETALKFKETCAIHAEGFSAAEARHGPRAVLGPDRPALAFATADAGGSDVDALARELRDGGVRVLLATTAPDHDDDLPLPAPLHPLLDPILAIASAYPMIASLAVARGRDPDRPVGLTKVTLTR